MFKVFLYICKNHRVMEEIWKDIKGYEGLYQVSNLGRVRSLDRIVVYSRNNAIHLHKGKVLIPTLNSFGYCRLNLYKNGKNKNVAIHQLVAQAFISNPNNLPQINHRNEIKTDNRVENLEYCTAKENQNYGSCIERRAKKHFKSIFQLDLSSKLLKEWNSITQITQTLGYNKSCISETCRGNQNTAYGFKWYYKPILWDTTKLISGRYSPEFLLKEMGVQS